MVSLLSTRGADCMDRDSYQQALRGRASESSPTNRYLLALGAQCIEEYAVECNGSQAVPLAVFLMWAVVLNCVISLEVPTGL